MSSVRSRGSILLTDHDRASLRSCSRGLSRAGFQVTVTSEAKDALRRVESETFDVFIGNSNVPEVKRLTLLRTIRERVANLALVLILECPNNEIALKASEVGVFQSLIEPVDPETLEKTAAFGVRLSRQKPGPSSLKAQMLLDKSASFTATEAKNEFGRVLEKAMQGDLVLITKHDAPKAVVLSMEEFNQLSQNAASSIDSLSAEFDALLVRMQSPAARKAMDRAFHAFPQQLGRAALAAARKRE